MTETSTPNTAHDPEADLALIRNMMAAGRRRAGINGAHLVWWGALLAFTFFYQYATILGWVPHYGAMPWVIMTAVGWAGSFFLGHKDGRSGAEHNPALAAYGSAWMAVGITMILFLLTAFIGNGSSHGSATILSSGVIGCAFFVMAHVLRLRPMYFAAAGWWAIMSYALLYPAFPKETVLVLSGASILFVLVPGLYLQRIASDES